MNIILKYNGKQYKCPHPSNVNFKDYLIIHSKGLSVKNFIGHFTGIYSNDIRVPKALRSVIVLNMPNKTKTLKIGGKVQLIKDIHVSKVFQYEILETIMNKIREKEEGFKQAYMPAYILAIAWHERDDRLDYDNFMETVKEILSMRWSRVAYSAFFLQRRYFRDNVPLPKRLKMYGVLLRKLFSTLTLRMRHSHSKSNSLK